MVDKLKTYALLAPALVPLVYLDIFLYPLVSTKAFFFRIAITVAILAITYLAVKGMKLYTDRFRSWWAWIPAFLLVVAYVTSAFGIDFYHSFWSIFDRSAGLLALTYMVAYTYLLMLVVDKEFIRRFFKLTAFVASVVSVYAIIQWLGEIAGIVLPGFLEPSGRIGGTVGNAAFLAGYLGLTFFITWIVAKGDEKYREWWVSGAILQLIAIILTATRGTILALMVAGLVTLAYLAIRKSGTLRKIGIGGLVGVLILGGVFFGFREALQQVPFEPVARIANIGAGDATTQSRLFVWSHMFEYGVKDPLTGYGSEHVDYVFNQFYNPEDILEQWFDRAHNSYLDYFVQYGVFGVLAILLLILTLFRFALRRRQENTFEGNMLILLVGVYVLQNMFVFDTINTFVVIMPLFAFAFVGQGEGAGPSLPMKGMFVGGSALALAGLYFAVLLPMYANAKLGEAYLYHVEDADRFVAAFQAGYKTNTFADLEFGYQAYAMYTDRQQHLLSGEEKEKVYLNAYSTLMQNVEKYPYDARTLVYLGHVIEARPQEVPYNLEENISVLRKAMELSPYRSQPYYMLANIYISQANSKSGGERQTTFDQAIGVLEEYRDIAPGLAEPHLVLAELYRVLGRSAQATISFEKGVSLYTGDGRDARRIAGYLLSQNKISEAKPYLEDAYRERPDDYVVAFDLAKVRFIEGDIDGAVELVERIAAESPQTLASDPGFIESLQNALQ